MVPFTLTLALNRTYGAYNKIISICPYFLLIFGPICPITLNRTYCAYNKIIPGIYFPLLADSNWSYLLLWSPVKKPVNTRHVYRPSLLLRDSKKRNYELLLIGQKLDRGCDGDSRAMRTIAVPLFSVILEQFTTSDGLRSTLKYKICTHNLPFIICCRGSEHHSRTDPTQWTWCYHRSRGVYGDRTDHTDHKYHTDHADYIDHTYHDHIFPEISRP